MSHPDFIRTDGSSAVWQVLASGGVAAVASRAECQAQCKTVPEDFVVHELLGWQPGGAGEHLLVQVRKRGLNSADVVDALAKAVKLKSRDLGMAGMKDRVAVTEQWVSLPWPIKQSLPDWPSLTAPLFSDRVATSVEILDVVRHHRKLPRGAHTGNRFRIVLRDFAGDRQLLERRLLAVQLRGFPNYYGPQRFGRDGSNVRQALSWFDGTAGRVSRTRQGLLLSAARSYLFNRICSQRVSEGNWLTPRLGEPMLLDASSSYFLPETIDAELLDRIARADVHTSGPLMGAPGKNSSAAEQASYEREHQQLLADPIAASLCQGLLAHGVASARRALRAAPKELLWHWAEPDTLVLQFELAKGVYASALLLECLDVQEPSAGAANASGAST